MSPPAPTRVRYLIVGFLFVITTVNYADRATISMAGPTFADDLVLTPVAKGWLFSAFAWSYAILQIPGGWLLDRLGSRRVYLGGLALWSLFTLLQGFVGWLPASAALAVLFGLRVLLGVAESPSFPANSRIVATWFPVSERGTAAAIFNSAQYFATVAFAPIMGSISHALGWPEMFWFMGALGLVLCALWPKLMHGPEEHPRVNAAELSHIRAGGGLVDLDRRGTNARTSVSWRSLQQLLTNRMLLGVFVAQYGITTLTWFFLTWFPDYLQKNRGMSILQVGFVATLPALCGFAGGILGGWFSDRLLRRGHSLTFARKTPIVAGMLLSTVIVVCNYVDATWLVIVCLSLAFFGKGVGALGWAVVSDTAPRQITGLCGGVFNTFGNVAGIVMPVVVGYIWTTTGSFNGALVFVGAHAVLAVACYLFVVGEIKRVELAPA